jgi:hypothetical protein
MNKNQQLVLLSVAIIVFVMLLYPPFQIMGRGMGYSWLFSPPHEMATVNTAQLIAQWLGVVIVGGIAFLLLKNNNEKILTSLQKKPTSSGIEDQKRRQVLLEQKVADKSPKYYAKIFSLGAAIFGFLAGMNAGYRSMRDTEHSFAGGTTLGLIVGLPVALVFWVVTYIVVFVIAKAWFFLTKRPPSVTK